MVNYVFGIDKLLNPSFTKSKHGIIWWQWMRQLSLRVIRLPVLYSWFSWPIYYWYGHATKLMWYAVMWRAVKCVWGCTAFPMNVGVRDEVGEVRHLRRMPTLIDWWWYQVFTYIPPSFHHHCAFSHYGFFGKKNLSCPFLVDPFFSHFPLPWVIISIANPFCLVLEYSNISN